MSERYNTHNVYAMEGDPHFFYSLYILIEIRILKDKLNIDSWKKLEEKLKELVGEEIIQSPESHFENQKEVFHSILDRLEQVQLIIIILILVVLFWHTSITFPLYYYSGPGKNNRNSAACRKTSH